MFTWSMKNSWYICFFTWIHRLLHLVITTWFLRHHWFSYVTIFHHATETTAMTEFYYASIFLLPQSWKGFNRECNVMLICRPLADEVIILFCQIRLFFMSHSDNKLNSTAICIRVEILFQTNGLKVPHGNMCTFWIHLYRAQWYHMVYV